MKLICPCCAQKKNIGAKSRFLVFTCDGCGHRFRGIHANYTKLSALLDYFNPFFGALRSADRPADSTACPFCGGPVSVCEALGDGTPVACGWCGSELPITEAEQC